MVGFQNLDDKEGYCKILTELYREVPKKFSGILTCEINADNSEIENSYNEYCAYIKYFIETLESRNPDHYKRAGALLLALNGRDIVKSVDISFTSSLSGVHDSCFLPVGVSYGDNEHLYPYLRMFEENPNSVMAFSICYRMMALYEKNVKNLFYTIEYYNIVCSLLEKDKRTGKHLIISPDSAFLLFKSLAQ